MSNSARRMLSAVLLVLGAAAGTAPASAQTGELQVEIHEPADGLLIPSLEPEIEVSGGASIFGGVRHLDLFLVMDASRSLLKTDPRDFRAAGAVRLVQSLPAKSDIQIGVVAFGSSAELKAPLSRDRSAAVAALKKLRKSGSTDIADGIRKALAGFADRARPGSSRVMLLFTDGKSDEDEARDAMQEAKRRGVALHTLMLGSGKSGAELLAELARGTGGSFLRVTNPAKLPEAFMNLRTTGVESVTLSVNGSPPVQAPLLGGSFRGKLPLQLGENRIVASATSLEGERRQASVTVTVSNDVHVQIETPEEGTVYPDRRQEATVTGWASLFAKPEGEDMVGRDHGIERVVLRVDQSPPFATTLVGGQFEGRVMLHEGENRILATAVAKDGRVADSVILVTVKPPGCGELEVQARRDGSPALSLSDRSVQIVFDASNSMWGRMQGDPKMSVAKATLGDALDWLPDDLALGLRVYGHQHAKEQRNCRDSELLVPLETDNRGRIRDAISRFRPRGQTPLAYSLEQVAQDFQGVRGERAVVLVTDGIESCGGDPVAAAKALQKGGRVPVHVIGFGMGSKGDADLASLRAIAQASGGKFVAAGSAQELRDALSATVGTAYRVLRGGRPVAEGALGDAGVLRLPPGDYEVRIESTPPYRAPVRVGSEEQVTLLLERRGRKVSYAGRRRPAEYFTCEEDPWLARPMTREPVAPASVPASVPGSVR